MNHAPECRPELVQAYADAQLGLTESLEVERHLQNCARCSAQYSNQRALSGLIADAALYYHAPRGLLDRIETELEDRGPLPRQTTPARRESFWRAFALAASAAFLIVLGAGTYLNLERAVPDDRTMHDVLSSHIRSLMLNHLTDVASTDQHTVKPWFNGKLNFSPPVRDFAQQGFALVGGRIDVVDNQPVAVLVYRRNRHVINLFLWPSSRPSAAQQTTVRRGYNIIHGVESGDNYWAVSDVSRGTLEDFVRLIEPPR
jgi:anti-sigma factor RsiW